MNQAVKDRLQLIPALENTSETVLENAIEDAEIELSIQGISNTHVLYDRLIYYYTVYVLSSDGYINQVASEKIGDMSVSYGKSDATATWSELYFSTLIKATGVKVL